MRANRSGLFEPSGIIDSRPKRQCCYGPNSGNGHQSQADLIMASGPFDPSIKLPIVLIQGHPCVEQRHKGMRQNIIHFDHRTYDAIKTSM